MLLNHLGYPVATKTIEEAIAAVLDDGKTKTPDMGGGATTQEVGEAIAEYILSR